MEDDVIQTGVFDDDGTYVLGPALPKSQVRACPHVIFLPDHYREDGSCRCDDPTHIEMKEWGYTWDAKAKEWV